jgi:predicted TPR repeat methyltransferase/tetratricopeptide (TPR) repeat protein
MAESAAPASLDEQVRMLMREATAAHKGGRLGEAERA